MDKENAVHIQNQVLLLFEKGNWAAGMARWTKGWLSHCPECGFLHQHVMACLPPQYQGKETGESLPLKGCPG